MKINPIKVLIADNQILMRQGLKHLCQTTDYLTVSVDAQVDDHLYRHVHVTKPDVMVIGLIRYRAKELKVLQRIRRKLPHVPILLLVESEEVFELYPAIRAGIRGYLPKTATLTDLIQAIKAINHGKYLIDPQIAIRALSQEMQLNVRPTTKDLLTRHEMEVLRLVSYGIDNKNIAKALNNSVHTVANRLRVIYEKLHVSNRTQAALFALRQGWVALD